MFHLAPQGWWSTSGIQKTRNKIEQKGFCICIFSVVNSNLCSQFNTEDALVSLTFSVRDSFLFRRSDPATEPEDRSRVTFLSLCMSIHENVMCMK